MATVVKHASLTINISDTPVNPPPVTSYDGYRVLHKIEGGWQNTPPGMPEVMPPIDAVSVDMTEAIQLMSFELFLAGNPALRELYKTDPSYVKRLWTRVHDGDRAFTNYQGFDQAGDPRANFVTGENKTSPLPKYDKAQRVCGGSFVRGVVDGDYLYCTSGVHGINPDTPMPDAETIIKNHWFVYAVSVNSDFTKIDHFPQGQGDPVLIPFIFRGTIKFPLYYFQRWQAEALPDPLRIYV